MENPNSRRPITQDTNAKSPVEPFLVSLASPFLSKIFENKAVHASSPLLTSSEERIYYSQTPQPSGRPCFEFLKAVSRYSHKKTEFHVDKLKNESEEPPLPLHCKLQEPQDRTVKKKNKTTRHGSDTSEDHPRENTEHKVKKGTRRW